MEEKGAGKFALGKGAGEFVPGKGVGEFASGKCRGIRTDGGKRCREFVLMEGKVPGNLRRSREKV